MKAKIKRCKKTLDKQRYLMVHYISEKTVGVRILELNSASSQSSDQIITSHIITWVGAVVLFKCEHACASIKQKQNEVLRDTFTILTRVFFYLMKSMTSSF